MKRKAVSGTLVTLLLMSFLTPIFNIQPVKAEPGPIYIRADGSVDPPNAPILNVGNVYYTFTADIYESIVVERDNIVVDGADHTLQGTGIKRGVDLSFRSNVTIKNMKIKRFLEGISLYSSSNNNISGNQITRTGHGVYLDGSSGNSISRNNMTILWNGIFLLSSSENSISGNNLTRSTYGIWFYSSSNNDVSENNMTANFLAGIFLYNSLYNTIIRNNMTANNIGIELYDSSNNILSENNIENNRFGIYLYYSSDNEIFHNNFKENTKQALVDMSSHDNLWDDNYPSGGNYWSDYTGIDADGDGIGDTPYSIDGDKDNYPLMEPFENYEEIGYAIIVAGQADWKQKWAIDHSANNAYRVLRNLGFDDNHIFYLNTGSQQIDGQNVVDHFTSLDNLRNSLDEIKNKIGDNPTPLILYLVGHGTEEVFDFYTESDALSSTELREMLEPFHDNLMLVVIGSCYSGSFITLDGITDSISAPNRIIITAAHDDEERWSAWGLGGWYYSSDRFWGNLNKGLNVKDAFITNAWWEEQEHLWLDDNGDYIGSPPHNLGNDGELASATTIGVAGSDDLELTSWYSVWIHSAGEVRVYDSQNLVTGLFDGEIREEIPNSIYDEQNEIVAIFSPYDTYRYEIAGTETGTYGLDIAFIKNGEATTFTVAEIPTLDNTIHQYTIDWDALSLDKEGVTLQIDSDGDGTFEQTITADNELTRDEFMLQTATTIDFDPDTLNLESKGKWVTAYIELPEGYNVGDIDTPSIELTTEVGEGFTKEVDLEAPAAIGDYDDDGIADLMVKFDRQILINYLKDQGYGDGDMIELIVTGEATGTRFEGLDTIQVISKGKS